MAFHITLLTSKNSIQIYHLRVNKGTKKYSFFNKLDDNIHKARKCSALKLHLQLYKSNNLR